MSALKRPLGNRTLSICVSPAPFAFAESRAILHALKKHTEIEFFKRLNPDAGTFLLQTSTPHAATTLIDSSPLELEYHPSPYVDGLPPIPSTTSSISSSSKIFQIHVSATNYPHAKAIADHPLYGPWPDERNLFDKTKGRMDSLVLNALMLETPRDGAYKGLRDWETGGEERAWKGLGGESMVRLRRGRRVVEGRLEERARRATGFLDGGKRGGKAEEAERVDVDAGEVEREETQLGEVEAKLGGRDGDAKEVRVERLDGNDGVNERT